MRSRDYPSLLWGDAVSLLERAERLHRQFFRMGSSRMQVWEPPVDVVESPDRIDVLVALPGVVPDSVAITADAEGITVVAARPFAGGAAAGGARIHRVEIPYGRFARRIELPMAALDLAEQRFNDGCLRLSFARRPRRTDQVSP